MDAEDKPDQYRGSVEWDEGKSTEGRGYRDSRGSLSIGRFHGYTTLKNDPQLGDANEMSRNRYSTTAGGVIIVLCGPEARKA